MYFIFSTLSDAVGDIKTNIGEIELLSTAGDFDVFQKGNGMCKTAQDILAQEYDHHPRVSDGVMLNVDDQSTFVSSIMAYGSVQTGKMLYIIVVLWTVHVYVYLTQQGCIFRGKGGAFLLPLAPLKV